MSIGAPVPLLSCLRYHTGHQKSRLQLETAKRYVSLFVAYLVSLVIFFNVEAKSGQAASQSPVIQSLGESSTVTTQSSLIVLITVWPHDESESPSLVTMKISSSSARPSSNRRRSPTVGFLSGLGMFVVYPRFEQSQEKNGCRGLRV
jgi:hypothetical protein